PAPAAEEAVLARGRLEGAQQLRAGQLEGVLGHRQVAGEWRPLGPSALRAVAQLDRGQLAPDSKADAAALTVARMHSITSISRCWLGADTLAVSASARPVHRRRTAPARR